MRILHVISSPRGDASFSIKLGNGIIDKLKAANPGSTVTVRDLATNPFPQLEAAKLQSWSTAAPDRTPAQHEAVKHSDDAIAEVQAADVLVVDAPLYNFNVPSTLKAWIDHIVRAGITFQYVDGKPKGLIEGKKVYVAMASGNIYSEGAYTGYDFIPTLSESRIRLHRDDRRDGGPRGRCRYSRRAGRGRAEGPGQRARVIKAIQRRLA